MTKEPFYLKWMRFFLVFALFIFVFLSYWSSLVIEENLQSINKKMTAIEAKMDNLSASSSSMQNAVPLFSPPIAKLPENQTITENLLKADPFYQTKLPKLLGPAFKPQGTRKEASIGKPDNLHPFNNWSHVAGWTSACTVSLVGQDVGKYETYTPEMALTMELKNGNEYWLTLRSDVYWQPLNPGHFSKGVILAPHFLKTQQVTAHDFKFYYDAIMNPNVDEEQAVSLRSYYGDIEELKVIDDLTLMVRWKTENVKDSSGQDVSRIKYLAKSLTGSLKPLARFVYQYFPDGSKIIEEQGDDPYRKSAIWAQNFAQHWAKNIIVSCGGWLFDGMTEREIRFRRNPSYFNPLSVLVNELEIKFKDSPDTIWEEFKLGQLDLFQVPPNQLAELDSFLKSVPYQAQVEEGLEIKTLDYLGRTYSYIGWNEMRPWFKETKVRQALTMAIDRERIIRQNLNGMGVQTTGPFFPFSPSYDSSIEPYPYDPDLARQLLQEEGWSDAKGTGILEKTMDNQSIPFSFSLTYFVKNATTKAICEYISTSLKEIGIDCRLNGVDMADLSAIFSNKNFDAVCLGWALGSPPEDPRQLWSSKGAKEPGSSNAIGFANEEIDQIIDQLTYVYNEEERTALYHRFSRIIYEEAPYTFLYVPKTRLAYRNYLKNVFIPAQKQEWIPGANMVEPQSSLYWIDIDSPK